MDKKNKPSYILSREESNLLGKQFLDKIAADKVYEAEVLKDVWYRRYREEVNTNDDLINQIKKLNRQINIAIHSFKNILDVEITHDDRSYSDMVNYIEVMKNSAEKALASIKDEGSGDESNFE